MAHHCSSAFATFPQRELGFSKVSLPKSQTSPANRSNFWLSASFLLRLSHGRKQDKGFSSSLINNFSPEQYRYDRIRVLVVESRRRLLPAPDQTGSPLCRLLPVRSWHRGLDRPIDQLQTCKALSIELVASRPSL